MAEKEKKTKVAKPKAEKAKAEKTTKGAVTNPVLYDVVRVPLVTEKSTNLSQFNKVVFRVRDDATKKDVKQAVEAVFGVQVVKVNTLNKRGKLKGFRGRLGRQVGYKKAIVSLAEGQSIDVMAGV